MSWIKSRRDWIGESQGAATSICVFSIWKIFSLRRRWDRITWFLLIRAQRSNRNTIGHPLPALSPGRNSPPGQGASERTKEVKIDYYQIRGYMSRNYCFQRIGAWRNWPPLCSGRGNQGSLMVQDVHIAQDEWHFFLSNVCISFDTTPFEQTESCPKTHEWVFVGFRHVPASVLY